MKHLSAWKHGDAIISGAVAAITTTQTSPYLNCSRGARGKLKASGLEFEIIDTTSTTSTIKIKPWGDVREINDAELRQIAVGIVST